ncbi:rhodanese-like domain-containing protein [Hydrogenimonas sp.]
MKKLLLAFLFLPLLLMAEVRDLNIAGFEKLKQNGIPVIDIRTPMEWKETGIIDGSHTIMFFAPDGSYNVQEFLHRLKQLGIDKKTPFILVCRSASRTRMLGNFLNEKMGYENVYHLTGGILNWKAHGKPLVPYKP